MKEKLFGIRSMRVEKTIGDATHIDVEFIATPGYNPYHMEHENWTDLFPGNVVVKCAYCGQWAARKTACKSCGAVVD